MLSLFQPPAERIQEATRSPDTINRTEKKCIRKCANKERLISSKLALGECSFKEGKFSNTWNASSDVDFIGCLQAAKMLGFQTTALVSELSSISKKEWKAENGIVFSSKRSQLKLVFATISVIREYFNSSLPIEVFIEKEDSVNCRILLKNLSISCRVPVFNDKIKKVKSRFGWKALSILQSNFKNVLWMDTDCIPLINPKELLQNRKFLEYGAVFWPDLIGVQCKPEDVSIWPSGSSVGALWDVFGVKYRGDIWKHVQEMESGQMLIDTEKYNLALHLAYFLTENGIFQQFAYGDKEAFRWSWLHLGLDYYFAEYPALMSYHENFDRVQKQCSRLHFLDGRAAFLHGKKRSRTTSNCGYHENLHERLRVVSIPRHNPRPISGMCYGEDSFHNSDIFYSFKDYIVNASTSIQNVENFWEKKYF